MQLQKDYWKKFMIKVICNGEVKETDCRTLLEFLREKGLVTDDPKSLFGFAVGVNDEVISKKDCDQYILRENDVIEIFTMVAGG
jgi:thiamine biosynthesis protein ThiS